MRAKCLTILLTLASISGCCNLPPHPRMDMPEGPVIEPLGISDEDWRDIPEDVRQRISDNARKWEDFWDAVESAYYEHNRIFTD